MAFTKHYSLKWYKYHGWEKIIEFPKHILYLNLCTGEYEKIKVDVELFSEIGLSVFKDKLKWNLNKTDE